MQRRPSTPTKPGQQDQWVLFVVVVLLALGWTAVSLAKPNVSVTIRKPSKPFDGIVVWTRTAGQYGSTTSPKPTNIKRMAFATLPTTTAKLFDAQYNKTRTYRGLTLRTLLKRYGMSKDVDMALLHFRNGMVVPVPVRLAKIQTPMPVFIATHWKQKKGWTRSFPSTHHVIAKKKKFTKKKKLFPVVFGKHKVVSSTTNHPMIAPHLIKDMAIWRHVDTLARIELVQQAAYYKQFAVSKSRSHKRGLRVFRYSCQFCHGVRQNGASFGVDFTKPVSVHLYINQPEHLRFHVRNRSSKAAKFGHLMPAITRLTARESRDVWNWMKGLWKKKTLSPYKPLVFGTRAPATRPVPPKAR